MVAISLVKSFQIPSFIITVSEAALQPFFGQNLENLEKLTKIGNLIFNFYKPVFRFNTKGKNTKIYKNLHETDNFFLGIRYKIKIEILIKTEIKSHIQD